jgi:ferredoxin-thioredoxin reductase catalytic chain
MIKKTFFRCTVCNDIHYGNSAPEICPTCQSINSFVSIEGKEVEIVVKLKDLNHGKKGKQLTRGELLKIWRKWCENKDFKLNSDNKFTNRIVVLELEKKKGLKYCPCRLPTNDFDKDLELICPCNFKIQKTWIKRKDCWCGLFVKK